MLSLDDVLLPQPPVHYLENVDGNPSLMRTACERFTWTTQWPMLLDPNRTPVHEVTCQDCLRVIAADSPTIVRSTT